MYGIYSQQRYTSLLPWGLPTGTHNFSNTDIVRNNVSGWTLTNNSIIRSYTAQNQIITLNFDIIIPIDFTKSFDLCYRYNGANNIGGTAFGYIVTANMTCSPTIINSVTMVESQPLSNITKQYSSITPGPDQTTISSPGVTSVNVNYNNAYFRINWNASNNILTFYRGNSSSQNILFKQVSFTTYIRESYFKFNVPTITFGTPGYGGIRTVTNGIENFSITIF